MKPIFGFTFSVLICLCLTSCAGIFRTTYYITETDGWKKLKPCSEGGITYTYDVTPDTVMLNVRGPGTSAITVGPIFFRFPHMPSVLGKRRIKVVSGSNALYEPAMYDLSTKHSLYG